MSRSRAATARRCSSRWTSPAWRSRPARRAAPDRWNPLRSCSPWGTRPRWPAARSASPSGAAPRQRTSTRSAACFPTWSRGRARARTGERADRPVAAVFGGAALCGAELLLEQAPDNARDAERLADHLVVEGLQRVAELRGGLVPLVGVAVQRPAQHVRQPRGEVLAQLLQRLDLSVAHGLLQLLGVAALEGAPVADDLVEHERGAPQVHARRQGSAVELLRSEVRELAPERLAAVAAHRAHLGDAEVAQLDLPQPRDEQVRGRDVAVDDVEVQARRAPRLVRVGE